MTATGQVYFPIYFSIPDRWSYSFDGSKLTLIEEFDDLSEERWQVTLAVCQRMGAKPERIGNKVILEMEVDQTRAVKGLLSEAILQGVILHLIWPPNLYIQVIECMNSPIFKED